MDETHTFSEKFAIISVHYSGQKFILGSQENINKLALIFLALILIDHNCSIVP